MPVILATTPTTLPPSPGATYDKWWVYSIQVNGANPADVEASVQLRKYRLLPDGVSIEFSPSDAVVQFTVGQIVQSTDPNVQSAFGAILAAVQALAAAQNLL